MQLLVEIENTPKDAFEGKRASMNLLDVKQIVEFHNVPSCHFGILSNYLIGNFLMDQPLSSFC